MNRPNKYEPPKFSLLYNMVVIGVILIVAFLIWNSSGSLNTQPEPPCGTTAWWDSTC